jgi:hypothetical protein
MHKLIMDMNLTKLNNIEGLFYEILFSEQISYTVWN